MPRYLPVDKNAHWPQDALQVPSVIASQMPPVSRANRSFVKREAMVMATPPTALGGEPIGAQINITIPTDQDGDFWCDQISLLAIRADGTIPQLNASPVATIGITDVRTGRSLTRGPDPPAELWRRFRIVGSLVTSEQIPMPLLGFSLIGQLPQPFCFTRQGGILLTYTSFSANAADKNIVTMGFFGWKEYAYDRAT